MQETEESGSDMYKRWMEDLSPAEFMKFKKEREQRLIDSQSRGSAILSTVPDHDHPWGDGS